MQHLYAQMISVFFFPSHLIFHLRFFLFRYTPTLFFLSQSIFRTLLCSFSQHTYQAINQLVCLYFSLKFSLKPVYKLFIVPWNISCFKFNSWHCFLTCFWLKKSWNKNHCYYSCFYIIFFFFSCSTHSITTQALTDWTHQCEAVWYLWRECMHAFGWLQ